MWRLRRTRELRVAATRTAIDAFVADYTGLPGGEVQYAVVAITDDVLADAAALSGARGLRAYDAVQLASARAAAGADDRIRTLAAFDRRLRAAAAEEGFAVVPPHVRT